MVWQVEGSYTRSHTPPYMAAGGQNTAVTFSAPRRRRLPFIGGGLMSGGPRYQDLIKPCN